MAHTIPLRPLATLFYLALSGPLLAAQPTAADSGNLPAKETGVDAAIAADVCRNDLKSFDNPGRTSVKVGRRDLLALFFGSGIMEARIIVGQLPWRTELALEDMRRGFFAERIYLGDRDLLPWRRIGYPEACYD